MQSNIPDANYVVIQLHWTKVEYLRDTNSSDTFPTSRDGKKVSKHLQSVDVFGPFQNFQDAEKKRENLYRLFDGCSDEFVIRPIFGTLANDRFEDILSSND